MNYKEYLQNSKIAKISLVLLIADIIAALYITIQLSKYMGVMPGVIGGLVIITAGALLWLCHYKKAVAAVVLEIFITVLLIVGIFAVSKINNVAGEISKTTEYEVVQIVALKDSPITAESDFSSYTWDIPTVMRGHMTDQVRFL